MWSNHVLKWILIIFTGSPQKGFNLSEEKPTLEELLKNANMGKFILDTVEEKIQELEAVCLKNDNELQGIRNFILK